MDPQIRSFFDGPRAQPSHDLDQLVQNQSSGKIREQGFTSLTSALPITNAAKPDQSGHGIASRLFLAFPSLTTIRRQGLRIAAVVAIFKATIEDGAPIVAF